MSVLNPMKNIQMGVAAKGGFWQIDNM